MSDAAISATKIRGLRAVSGVAVSAVLVCALIVAAGLFTLHWANDAIVEQTLDETAADAHSLRRYVMQQYETMNDVAEAVLREMDGRDPSNIPTAELRNLVRRIEVPFASQELGLFVFSTAGDNLLVSGPGTNVADREYFRAHAYPEEFGARLDLIRNAENGMVVSPPVFARVRNQEILSASKAIYTAAGNFAGVVNVSMPTARFQTMFSYFHADAEDALFIFRNDHVGLVREPSLANFSGAKIPNALVFQNYPRLPEGRFEGAAATDGLRRMGVHLTLAPWPIVLGSSKGIRGLGFGSIAVFGPAIAVYFAQLLVIFAFAGSAIWALLRAQRFQIAAGIERDAAIAAKEQLARGLAEQIELRADAEAADQAKSTFLAAMSHELRSPLNAIIGFAELLEKRIVDPADPKKVVEYQGYILESGRHLLDLINDILHLTRIQSATGALALETVCVRDVVDEAMRMVQVAADRKRVRFSIGISHGEANVQTDRRALLQILLNLCSNAVKFSPDGGTVSVAVDLDAQGGLRIVVCDEGRGMEPKLIAGIGTPFLRGADSFVANNEGIGLGLAITVQLVALLGGKLDLRNVQPHGLEACATFPNRKGANMNAPFARLPNRPHFGAE
jgi:signal transduction histidine kinase